MIPRHRVPAHPGEILRREYLEPLGLSVEELARRLGVAPVSLQELIDGARSMTSELASSLAQAFDTTSEFWLQLQAHHDTAVHRSDNPGPKHPNDKATYDVFISYARADAGEWTQVLAENLTRLGFRVFWDGWEIGSGDVLVHELDRGLLNSRTGVLVASREAMKRPWVQKQYAALLGRSVDGRQRLIPLMLHDVELPPLLATHTWVDFRQPERYEEAIQELARRLREEKLTRPKVGEPLQMPPGTGLKAVGPIRRRLVISKAEVVLRGGEATARGPAGELDIALDNDLWQLEQSRRTSWQGVPHRTAKAEKSEARESPLHGRLLKVGRELSSRFLPPAVAAGLEKAVKDATRLGSSLELGIEVVESDLRALPWETLRLPGPEGTFGEPLILHPRVQMYRVVTGDGAAPVVQIPGPLRVLVAIGSPESQTHGALLDYEMELARIVESLDPARRKGEVHVKILYRGTVAEIRKALDAEQYHVLYVSCHAGPGVLILEDEEGEEDEVSAERLWSEAFPANRQPPVVVLAGCATALGGVKQEQGEAGEAVSEARHLRGLAEDLLHHGVPVVVAMQASVGDEYARLLGASFFEALATFEVPDPLPALMEARRKVEQRRLKGEGKTDLAEWATPALWTLAVGGAVGRAALPLYDPEKPFETIEEPAPAVFAEGVVVRGVGDFVGRRREERLGLQVLRGQEKAGVLIHGIGGVGKSTLAVELLRRLIEEGRLVVSVAGVTDPGSVLYEIGKTLQAICFQQGVDERHPWRQLAVFLKEPSKDWVERWETLSQVLLPSLPLILFLDNFEDNLQPIDGSEYKIGNEQLADLLTRWLRSPGQSRVLMTSRHPFPLPENNERRLEELHLGPLSWPETRKLIWRLPALDELTPEEQHRAYVDVGGHPRALEYLDALLAGGKARFEDVRARMEKTLAEREGMDDPAAWLGGVAGDLNKALAAAVTVAAGDVLLAELLARLESEPLALRLLVGVSVYRLPVNLLGLLWQVGREVVRAEAADLARLEELNRKHEQGRSAAEEQEYSEIARRLRTLPLKEPEGLNQALRVLSRLGLLAETLFEEGGQPHYLVHRWTATALAELRPAEELQEAHRRAARHWRWQVERLQPKAIGLWLEARHHLYEAAKVEEAMEVHEHVCLMLENQGDYRREEQLLLESLSWFPEQSKKTAGSLHHLGNLTLFRGSYKEALEWYRKSLAIEEELGDRAGMAGSYHQLGVVAQEQGSYGEALDWYRKSLAIKEELDNRAGMARSYHQLGVVAQLQGLYGEALDWYRKSLAINEELGDRVGMATSHGQLGNLYLDRGSYEEALAEYRQALPIFKELGDRVGMAISYHQLGAVAEEQDSYGEALTWYRKSLAIEEELGNRAGMASSYHQIGKLLMEQGQAEEAVPWQLRALGILLDIGSPEVVKPVMILHHQRNLLGPERFEQIVEEHVGPEGKEAVLHYLQQYEEAQNQPELDAP